MQNLFIVSGSMDDYPATPIMCTSVVYVDHITHVLYMFFFAPSPSPPLLQFKAKCLQNSCSSLCSMPALPWQMQPAPPPVVIRQRSGVQGTT